MHLIKDENGNTIHHGHGEECHHHQEGSHGHHHGEDGHHRCGHGHSHEEGCGHHHHHEGCGGCKGEHDEKNETAALLTYMVQHNEHHAAELDQMAANLEKLGMEDAAKTIREGVADFQKANMRFSLALTQVKEYVKEA